MGEKRAESGTHSRRSHSAGRRSYLRPSKRHRSLLIPGHSTLSGVNVECRRNEGISTRSALCKKSRTNYRTECREYCSSRLR